MDYELSASQDELAQRIHAEAIVLLAHDHYPPAEDSQDLLAGGVTGKILMTIADVRAWSSDPDDYRRSIPQIEGWHEWARAIYCDTLAQIADRPQLLTILRSEDILRAKREGRTGVLLGSEGGKLIEYSLDNLRSLYTLGLRHVMLSWAYNNQLTGAELDPENRGLTPLGREVVGELNRLGMIVDITHLSRAAMAEVLELSTRPVLNSHSALKSISNRIPAMTEVEIRTLADQGGVFALHFMTHMLTGRFEPRASMREVMRQINAIVRIGGIDCLALGPDYLPYSDAFKRNTGQPNLTFPVGLESSAHLRNLTRALVAEDYSEEDIRKILGGNLLRLIRDTLD